MEGATTDSQDDIPRDEQKQRKKAEKQKEEMMKTVNGLLDTIWENPDVWKQPELQNLREFVHDVTDDPTTFPPVNDGGMVRSDHPSEVPQPTKGLASNIVNRVDFPLTPKKDECPVVCVLDGLN